MNQNNHEQLKQGKVVNHKAKVAFAQSKVCKAFAIVKHKSGKYIIVMGDNQLSERQFDTIKQAEEFIARKPYELIINAAFAAANFIINQQKQQNNESNN